MRGRVFERLDVDEHAGVRQFPAQLAFELFDELMRSHYDLRARDENM